MTDQTQLPPRFRHDEYSLPGGGCARFDMCWTTLTSEDIGDLRAWLALIDRRLVRMEETAAAESLAPTAEMPEARGEVVVTRHPDGRIVAVTRQDEDGKVLSVIAEAGAPSNEAGG